MLIKHGDVTKVTQMDTKDRARTQITQETPVIYPELEGTGAAIKCSISEPELEGRTCHSQSWRFSKLDWETPASVTSRRNRNHLGPRIS